MKKLTIPAKIGALLMTLLSLHVGADDIQTAGDDQSAERKTLIATVFDRPIYLEQLHAASVDDRRSKLPPAEFEQWLRSHRGRRIYQIIWGDVYSKLKEREQIEVTEEESAAIRRVVELRLKTEKKPPPDSTFTPEQRKHMMTGIVHAILIDWKVCRLLHEKYGGRVGLGSLGAWIAFDGQNALLREHSRAGDIKFHDPEIEKLFWAHMTIKNFADAYPTGEKLQRLLATPPYLRNLPAAVNETSGPQVFGGKSLDQWIDQAEQAANLDDRHNALQVLRNFGLKTDRAKTLRVFTELLSDDIATIRSLAAAGLRKAGRPTDPQAVEKLVEILSQDLTNLRAPQRDEDVGDEFVLPIREAIALSELGDKSHLPVLQRIADNKDNDPILRQSVKNALRQFATRTKQRSPNVQQAVAIRKLRFLVGTWKSVEPDHAPPAPETRTITQPDGLSLSVTSESTLGKGRPVHITFDLPSQEYLLTYTDADGQERVFRAKLMEENRLEIPVQGEKVLLAGMTFTVTVSGDSWTEAFSWPDKPNETLFQRTFQRQPRTP
jgi:hypothetical protein